MKHPRILLAQLMIRTGNMLRSLALMVMRPDDLVEFGRRNYARHDKISGWSSDSLLNDGLSNHEMKWLEKSPVDRGNLLLLGVGGGREAIPLAKRGYQVTGVDFVAGMIEQTQANAARRGLHVEGMVQDISRLDVPCASFDIAWISHNMYSCVPSRSRRIAMLKRIAYALRPGGVFICQFRWDRRPRISPHSLRLHRAVALLTWGYRQFEPGDMLWVQQEFLHVFHDECSLRAEFAEGGFKVLFMEVSDENVMGGAVLQKGIQVP